MLVAVLAVSLQDTIIWASVCVGEGVAAALVCRWQASLEMFPHQSSWPVWWGMSATVARCYMINVTCHPPCHTPAMPLVLLAPRILYVTEFKFTEFALSRYR